MGWIRSCLTSSFILVLVNESHTLEFKAQRGLRQGDPLAPFLLNIVVAKRPLWHDEASYSKEIFF